MIQEISVRRKSEDSLCVMPQTVIRDIKSFTFSGGEVHVEIPQLEDVHLIDNILITTRIQNTSDLIELLMATDALRRLVPINTPISVIIPYLPYARQDKISAQGEALSLRVFADLINAQGYAKIVTYDVHSDVSAALINNLKHIRQESILHYLTTKPDWASVLKNKVLVSPDTGASKKLPGLIRVLEPTSTVQADKVRNRAGEIVETVVHCSDLINEDVVIVDDIIDGGRTFIELAKVLKAKGCRSVTLFATHGIFSKGVDVLYEGGVDRIMTTDTFECGTTYHPGPIVGKIVGGLR